MIFSLTGQVALVTGASGALGRHFARVLHGAGARVVLAARRPDSVAALAAGFAGSRMLDLMGPKMAARDFAAGIEARLHHKDYGTIVAAAHEAGLALPAVALVAQQLNALVGQGWGGDDTSSLLRVLEAANGRQSAGASGVPAGPGSTPPSDHAG